MNLIIKNIKDISDDFLSFFESLDGYNYIVSGINISFKFSGLITNNFDKNLLKQLVSKGTYEEDFYLSDFNKAITKIKECLSYYTDQTGRIKKEENEKIIQTRFDIYWKIVSKYFTTPPYLIYEHIPFYESYFNFGPIWSFCFILINNLNEGILISAGASD